MKLAFIGLGAMGGPMAKNLRKKGCDLTVIARRPEVKAEYAALGCTVNKKAANAAGCDLIFLCLPSEAAVESVLLGEDALLSRMEAGQYIVDCSTIGYLTATKYAALCEEKGIRYLDAPISGHHAKAVDGTLTIMCGGREEDFKAVKPFLEKMGSLILHMGPAGSGQLTKMINNCALNICTASFCELMPLGVKLGLSAEKLGEVLMTATGSSYASKTLIPEILEGNFEHGFTMEKAYKDMKSMLEVSSRYAVPLPTLYGTLQTYQLALLTGQGDKYKGAMIRFYEDLLGVACRRSDNNKEE